MFGLAEAELCQAMEAFRVGGRRYRNSQSMCSDIDVGYDTPEDRSQRYTHSAHPHVFSAETLKGGFKVVFQLFRCFLPLLLQ